MLRNEKDFLANTANTAAVLYHLLPDVNWAGFYFSDGQELVLGPFQGKPACTRLVLETGVCGTAAKGETVIVPDVNKFEGHIVCDANSRSEIALPLMNWGKLVGVLDIDSPSLNRFDDEDRDGLEGIVSLLMATRSAGDLPDFEAMAAPPEA